MPTCFVLGPDSETPALHQHRFQVFHADVLTPVCSQLGFTLLPIHRPDITEPESTAWLDGLLGADVLIAHLSGRGTTFGYGLGLRHMIGRHTFHVNEIGLISPDLGSAPVILYPQLPGGLTEARLRIQTALSETVSGTSPTLMPPARALLREPAIAPVTEPEGSALWADDSFPEDGPGTLDHMASAEEAMAALDEDMAKVGAAFGDLLAMTELIDEDMRRSHNPRTPGNKSLVVLNRFARSLEGPAAELEEASTAFAEHAGVMVQAMGSYLVWMREMPGEEGREPARDILELSREHAAQMAPVLAQAQEFSAMLRFLSRTSRRMRKPARSIDSSLRLLLGSFDVLRGWNPATDSHASPGDPTDPSDPAHPDDRA
ncbi:hypothetical protein ACN20G_01065 [Streptomyces sp. BI20]|uniref:hypothetical protein n=1 Tax=Streptomyces sp. BI20 TaxID=3403460 RepID=UPI003C744D9D